VKFPEAAGEDRTALQVRPQITATSLGRDSRGVPLVQPELAPEIEQSLLYVLLHRTFADA